MSTDQAPETRYAAHTWPELADLPLADAVVLVPVGALEQHGHHLPVETDHAMADAVARAAAERLSLDGTPVLVTPAVWAGFSPHHLSFPGTISLRAETLMALITDIAVSLASHGVRRILFLNGHGGNTHLLGTAVQTLRFEHGVRAATANYWAFAGDRIRKWRRSDLGGINHACEMETSLMKAALPGSVREMSARGQLSDPGLGGVLRDLTEPAPVTLPLAFDELTADGSLGAWHLADQDRGEALLEAIVTGVCDFVREFRAWHWPGEEEQ